MGEGDTSERLNYKIAEYTKAVLSGKPEFPHQLYHEYLNVIVGTTMMQRLCQIWASPLLLIRSH